VQVVAQKRNPLAFYFWGSLVGWAASAAFAVVGHRSLVFTLAVGVCELVFVILYLRRSTYAWHAGLAMVIGFGVYHMSYGRQPHADIIIGTLLIAYFIVLRQRYTDYLCGQTGPKEI
jgi:hypothetical protein